MDPVSMVNYAVSTGDSGPSAKVAEGWSRLLPTHSLLSDEIRVNKRLQWFGMSRMFPKALCVKGSQSGKMGRGGHSLMGHLQLTGHVLKGDPGTLAPSSPFIPVPDHFSLPHP